MNTEIETSIDDFLNTLKNYIDAKSSGIHISVPEKIPSETVVMQHSVEGCATFSPDSIDGLIDVLTSMSNEIKFLREILGVSVKK